MQKALWRFSGNDSTIEFKIKYYKISNITGRFNDFRGSVAADEQFSYADISATIKSHSVDTSHEQTNRRLVSANCLDVLRHRAINFVAINGCKRSEGNIREITGFLTIKDLTAEITLVVNYSTVKKGPQGPIMVFGLFGTLNKQDFNISVRDDNMDSSIQITAKIALVKSV